MVSTWHRTLAAVTVQHVYATETRVNALEGSPGLRAGPRRTLLLNKLHPQISSHSLRGARERAKRHGFVLGVEKPVQLRAACLHALGKLGFGALGGFEYVAILAGECRSPARTIGRSVMVAAPVIAIMFILGTSSVLAFVENNWLSGQRVSTSSYDNLAGAMNDMFNFQHPDFRPLLLNPSTGAPSH